MSAVSQPNLPLHSASAAFSAAPSHKITKPTASITAQADKVTNAAVFAAPYQHISTDQYENRDITVPSNCNPKTCDEVIKSINTEFLSFAEGLDYNFIPFLEEFFTFYNSEKAKNPNISPSDAFALFKPDSSSEPARTHGATCVSSSKAYLKEKLQAKGIKGDLVVETASQNEPPTHAAIVLPCADGIILVETLKKSLIKIPYKEQPPKDIATYGAGSITIDVGQTLDRFMLGFETVTMPGNYTAPKAVRINVTYNEPKEVDSKQTAASIHDKPEPKKEVEILLKPARDPDQTVMKRYLIAEDNYPISHQKGEVNYVIKLKFGEGEKEYVSCFTEIGKKRTEIKIPFSEFLKLENPSFKIANLLKMDENDPKKLVPLTDKDKEIFLSDEFLKAFKSIDKASLPARICALIRQKDVLYTLRQEESRKK